MHASSPDSRSPRPPPIGSTILRSYSRIPEGMVVCIPGIRVYDPIVEGLTADFAMGLFATACPRCDFFFDGTDSHDNFLWRARERLFTMIICDQSF